MSDELLSFLLECFPEADFDLLAQSARINRTREEALDYVLAANATPGSEEYLQASKLNRPVEPVSVDPDQIFLAQLVEVFPEIRVSELTEVVKSRDPNQGLEDLIDQVIVQQGTYEVEYIDPSWIPSGKPKATRKQLPVDQFGFKTDSYREEQSLKEGRQSLAPFIYKKFSGLDTPASYDLGSIELREEISKLLQERRELFAKASEAHQRGGLTGTQSASYYSQKARDLEEEIDRLKIEASYRTFLKFNDDPYSRTLDLHHLTVDEAIPILDAFLEHHIRDQETATCPVKVITGAGNHSLASIGPRLRPAVWRRLGFSDYKFNYDGHAVFTVFGKQVRRQLIGIARD